MVNSDQILVMPGQGLVEADKEYAVICALPVDALKLARRVAQVSRPRPKAEA